MQVDRARGRIAWGQSHCSHAGQYQVRPPPSPRPPPESDSWGATDPTPSTHVVAPNLPPPSETPSQSPPPPSSSFMIRPTPTPSVLSSSVASPSDGIPRGKLDLSLDQSQSQTRRELLREAFFPDLQHDATGADWDHPDEMQKNDPLGTHMWKIISKVKTQITNHERMENMTWRLMAMSLKKKGEEQAR